MAFLGVVFHENLLVSPSLDQKEQNHYGHPQFYSLIEPMGLYACLWFVVQGDMIYGNLFAEVLHSQFSSDDKFNDT